MNKIRLLVIEDNRLLRDGIAAMLKGRRGISVIGATGNGGSGILRIHKSRPSIILLDLGLRSQNSLHVVEVVKREFPNAKIIVMDLAPIQADILQYVKAGATGFILKDTTADDFVATIRAVAEGAKVLPPLLADSLFSQIVEHAIRGGKAKLRESLKLTRREREVIGLVSDGMSNKDIAHRLHISSHTIKSHVHNIMEKLTLHTRLEVANYAFTEGGLTKEICNSISIIHR